MNTPIENEIAKRFGILPNFFRLASSDPAIAANLWGFALFAYLDNPLPSLFKERLFVYLSRFCEVRYCIARHVGFLAGLGYPAGDSSCLPQGGGSHTAVAAASSSDRRGTAAAISGLRRSRGSPRLVSRPRQRRRTGAIRLRDARFSPEFGCGAGTRGLAARARTAQHGAFESRPGLRPHRSLLDETSSRARPGRRHQSPSGYS